MRHRLILLSCLATAALAAAPGEILAQRADRKAVEALFDALPPPTQKVWVSPVILETGIQGKVTLDADNQAALERLAFVDFRESTDAIVCRDQQDPATCRIREGRALYQILMPPPIENGELHFRVLLMLDGKGTNGQIRREVWDVLMVQQPTLGWTAVQKTLERTADGPW